MGESFLKNKGRGLVILMIITIAIILVSFLPFYAQKYKIGVYNRVLEPYGDGSQARDFDGHKQEMIESYHKGQLQIEELKKNTAILNDMLSEKKKEIEFLKTGNTKSYNQAEQIKDLQNKVDELLGTVSDLELALLKKEKELRGANEEIGNFKKEFQSFKIAASDSIKAVSFLTEKLNVAQKKIGELEMIRESLQKDPREAQKTRGGKGVRVSTLFRDKEFKNLVAILAQKEDQIKQLENELASLRPEKVFLENIPEGSARFSNTSMEYPVNPETGAQQLPGISTTKKDEGSEAQKRAADLGRKVEVLLEPVN